MSVALRQPAHARVVTPGARERTVAVILSYDSADPLALRLTFPSGLCPGGPRADWTIGRELLARGLRLPAGNGNVHIWPCGPGRTVLEFLTGAGMALLQFDAVALHSFLARTDTAVPPGREDVTADVDRTLQALLGGV